MAFTSSLLNASDSLYNCVHSTGSNVLFTMFTFGHVLLLLPLHALVLLLGFQRWRRRRPASHSDVFTYHMVALEVVGVSGALVYCLGVYTGSSRLLVSGVIVCSVILPGQAVFHLLTCVERYLAVLHPVPYMHLRGSGGVRVRNLSVLCCWLLVFAWMALMYWQFPDFPLIPLLCLTSLVMVVVSFCCLSVLCALIRPGPGDGGGDRQSVDQSKQRAFVILRAVTGTVLLRLVALLVSHSLPYWHSLGEDVVCTLIDAALFVTIPSSLVLPLLFLHKVGKLPCCRGNTVNTEAC